MCVVNVSQWPRHHHHHHHTSTIEVKSEVVKQLSTYRMSNLVTSESFSDDAMSIEYEDDDGAAANDAATLGTPLSRRCHQHASSYIHAPQISYSNLLASVLP
jgi:hypothetical protein